MDADQALELARDAFDASSSYFNAAIRPRVESNLRQFQSIHPAGSKYTQDSYKGRSRLFTPKTRAMVTKNEAIGAEAFFSTNDVASLRAFDDADQVSSLACDILGPVLQHHLKHSIPWFLT